MGKITSAVSELQRILTLLFPPYEVMKNPLSRAGLGTTRIGVIRKTAEQKNPVRQT
jgi:cell division inhibitor SulA